jgi:translation initiation factor 4G
MSAKQKALEKKADNEAARSRKAAEDAERAEAAAWSVGAKDGGKQKALEDKEEEKRRKAAEKAALEAAEAAELSGVQRTGKPAKKKGKDDLDFLKQALAQQPKTKAQKEAEEKKRQQEERKKKEEEDRARKEAERKVSTAYFNRGLVHVF